MLAKLQSLLATTQSPQPTTPEPSKDTGQAAAAQPELLQGLGRRARRPTNTTVSSESTVDSDFNISFEQQQQQRLLSKREQRQLVAHRLPDIQRLSRLHPVSKVLQQTEWDCGLASVCMVLRSFGQATCTVLQLERDVQTQSVWTIDLAFLLRRHLPDHADFTYYTTCVGVNPQHASSEFYSMEIDEDFSRVIALFSKARVEQLVQIVEVKISLLDLKRFLVHRRYVALLLVDSRWLACVDCEQKQQARGRHKRSLSEMSRLGHRGVLGWLARRRISNAGFVGHYVLLIAYIPSLDMFVYRDPAIPEEFCLASALAVDAARSCPGTDHDCIIVKL
ncbi:hypothetical protein IWW36_001772 [Coemansia brasiliensis]|uniref:Guanylyl cyclase n=1 Tax=Coemansia brasiliensis TaxID=2650707 RepID=A0A9W8M025_9FUNG|nr:hypothetical protein IWW36_001772 [Coemansia brasiliensis]